MPHSALPVIGSTGTRRKNRTCRIRSVPALLAEVDDEPNAGIEPPDCAPVVTPGIETPALAAAAASPGFAAAIPAAAPASPDAVDDVTSTPCTSVSKSGGYPSVPTSTRIWFLSAASL